MELLQFLPIASVISSLPCTRGSRIRPRKTDLSVIGAELDILDGTCRFAWSIDTPYVSMYLKLQDGS